MKRIPLTQGKFALVDDEDYGRLMQWRWHLYSNRRGAFYASRNRKGYGNGTVRMHRYILDVPKDKEVDHKNHDGLDNRKCNLRICSHKENMYNRLPSRDCASIYKGVSFRKDIDKWRAIILNKHLGIYISEVDAAKAYDKKARKLFGEFAYCNFPD